MRLGVLDVGSNTVHLLVVDAHQGAPPLPAFSHKDELRLTAHLEDGNRLSELGARRLHAFVDDALRIAEDKGVEEVVAFATSAIRDAVNGEEVLGGIRDRSGIDIPVLSGEDEARLTFLAARRWFGWASGRLLLVDIGGGSLGMAFGADEAPEQVFSPPRGAGRLPRDFLPGDPPKASDVAALRAHVTQAVAERLRPFRATDHDLAVGTSKSLRSLARIAGAAPSSEGPHADRVLSASDAEGLVDKLADLSAKDRTKLPGVSARRAGQLLAAAIVASTTMNLLGIEQLRICPWALREGVILTRQDWLIHF